jgi:hypothetical protein
MPRQIKKVANPTMTIKTATSVQQKRGALEPVAVLWGAGSEPCDIASLSEKDTVAQPEP